LDSDLEQHPSNTRGVRVPGAVLRGGRYLGKTSQGHAFELVANRPLTKVTNVRYAIVLRCGGSSRTISYDLKTVLEVDVGGYFFDSFVYPPGASVGGTFRGSSVSGTLRHNYFDGNLKARCDTGRVRFSARRSA